MYAIFIDTIVVKAGDGQIRQLTDASAPRSGEPPDG
jgi:hypothetical protein